MVIAPGSVMNEPSSGAMMRIVIHQAAGVPPPTWATRRRTPSASSMIGRVDDRAMMTITNSGSAKLTPSFR